MIIANAILTPEKQMDTSMFDDWKKNLHAWKIDLAPAQNEMSQHELAQLSVLVKRFTHVDRPKNIEVKDQKMTQTILVSLKVCNRFRSESLISGA